VGGWEEEKKTILVPNCITKILNDLKNAKNKTSGVAVFIKK
jgi:hypothetical protein